MATDVQTEAGTRPGGSDRPDRLDTAEDRIAAARPAGPLVGNVAGRAAGARSTGYSALVLFAGWLVPGAGHLLLGKWIRGILLFASIFGMFVIGVALQGKIYTPNTGDLLDMLNFAGDLGNGLLYLVARVFDLGAATVQVAVADYGTKFIVVAGLLNIMAAVDAHSLAIGRKRS